ncbi:MAG: ATP-binding protein, partial [Saprospiraceae bacterium]
MQNSNELPEAANLLFLEVQALGIPSWSCGYNILSDDKKSSICIMSSEGQLQSAFQLPFSNSGEPSFAEWLEAIETKQSFFVQELSGKAIVDHYNYMKSLPQVGQVLKELEYLGLSLPTYQINHLSFFNGGFLLFITYEQVPHAHEIFKRFTKVFEQTYTRFLDLQKAEAQTRQAHLEAALERVRARALAMQQPEELKAVAEVLRHEMGLLGIEELETCSIYINDEQAEKAECWYALKDPHASEKKLVNDHFTLNLKDTWVGRAMLSFYNSNEKQISIVMQGANRKEWINYCEANSAPFRGYYGDVIPDRTYHLYKFSHGAIGAAAVADISDESWNLLKRAASVFSLAYSRFKDLAQARTDLIKLKEEKKRAEDALTNLQATQKQLIQSEKMASLGELTAGIAHEIQNPLNFVNNFSEVSKELLDELNDELENGNLEDVREIMRDVIQNLEKITHHGKRADAIVKGMLQHSRSNNGVKEPTDINTLCDEYLRLSYHGLRAKDKSFNATMKTDFDNTIRNINIIPQDIGRVILNLLTNAFYAVTERRDALHASQGANTFEPTVSISTKKMVDKVDIRVSDNGNGIPQKVLDKIFQPFFTTKPTGQGTGLGLSLSFEIVKAHGGEIKVTN